MRQPRLKPDYADTWHHCYNRIVGVADNYPFTVADKQAFVNILKRVAAFYTVRVVSYAIMGNHFHIILQSPMEKPSPEETAERYKAFYRGRRTIKPEGGLCRQWCERLRDVSWFMRHFQQLCTTWYNRTHPERRRGTLWQGRFKNTILGAGEALWNCWAYVEANPLRAKLVEDAAGYRFSAYGEWMQSGGHPFASNIENHLAPVLPFIHEVTTATEALELLQTRLGDEFPMGNKENVTKQAEVGEVADNIKKVTRNFVLTVRRRVRYWTDGAVIGTELFVREIMARLKRPGSGPRHRLDKAISVLDGDQRDEICSWRRLNPACD